MTKETKFFEPVVEPKPELETLKSLEVVPTPKQKDIRKKARTPQPKVESGMKIIPEIFATNQVTGEVEKHIFQELFEENELPTIRTIGLVRVNPNSKDWVALTIEIKGDRVITMEVSEPNMKLIAMDDAKMRFDKEYILGAE